MKIINSIICALTVHQIQCADDIQPRIIGNELAADDILYELAVITEDKQVCTATLIDPLWALTSAACASRSSRIRVKHDKDAGAFNDAKYVKDIYIHPAYNKANLLNDIALIELREPAPATSRQRDIPSTTEPFTSGVVFGYGADPNYKLKSAPVIILDTVICQKFVTMNAYRMCTYKTLACEGDQGGPLVSGNKLVGIVSMDEFQALSCSATNQFEPVVVYTRVAPYKLWIKSVTKLNYL